MQKRPTPAELLASCACTRARTYARLITRRYDELLRPSGLKASQLAVLAAVASEDVASIAELSRLLSMDRTTLSRNLKPLFAMGLVTMAVEGTGRGKAVKITVDGRRAFEAAVPFWQEAQAHHADLFGKARLAAADHQLKQLIAAY